jgi:hypothetical protein
VALEALEVAGKVELELLPQESVRQARQILEAVEVVGVTAKPIALLKLVEQVAPVLS